MPASSDDELVLPDVVAEATDEPDKLTKSGQAFFKGGAPRQVFRLEGLGVSYGTDDKSHAAAVLLSIFLGLLLNLVFIIGAFADPAWIADAIKVLGTALTFTIGVAIGQGGKTSD